MKPIVIRRFCHLSIPFLALLLFGVSVFLWFIYAGIATQSVTMIVIGTLLLSIILCGCGFFWCYGIKITDKHVTVLYHNTWRVFRYDDITRIEIGFDNDSIWGEIKARGQPLYCFDFDDFELDTASLLSRLWSIKIKLTHSYIDRKIKQLSNCKKVTVINRYDRKH